jgi:tetratricopeptide (TPR) repeat protein
VYYFQQELYTKALACFQRTKYVLCKKLGPQSLASTDSLFNIGLVQKQLGNPTKALQALQECASIRRVKMGP